MIVCLCNGLRERDCHDIARGNPCKNAGCVYRHLGVRVRCGRCVPTMQRIVEAARAQRRAPELVAAE